MAQIAFTQSFLNAIIPFSHHDLVDVFRFLAKFMANPGALGLNYEKLHGTKDDKVWSARIDQVNRAIILHPPKGDVYPIVWAGREEDAYQWARKKVFDWDTISNKLIITTCQDTEETAPEYRQDTTRSGILADHDDETLVSLGVPEILLPSVRSIENPERFDLLKTPLSIGCIRSLRWLSEGIPLHEIRDLDD
jgi:hypothetical protein